MFLARMRERASERGFVARGFSFLLCSSAIRGKRHNTTNRLQSSLYRGHQAINMIQNISFINWCCVKILIRLNIRICLLKAVTKSFAVSANSIVVIIMIVE